MIALVSIFSHWPLSCSAMSSRMSNSSTRQSLSPKIQFSTPDERGPSMSGQAGKPDHHSALCELPDKIQLTHLTSRLDLKVWQGENYCCTKYRTVRVTSRISHASERLPWETDFLPHATVWLIMSLAGLKMYGTETSMAVGKLGFIGCFIRILVDLFLEL